MANEGRTFKKTRWPERYGEDWEPSEANTLPLRNSGNSSDAVERLKVFSAALEDAGLPVEIFLWDGYPYLRGPYIDDMGQ